MNIFGEGLPKEIISQVNRRQKTYGTGYAGATRTNEDILTLNANTGWIKLLSSVNIPDVSKINNPSIQALNLTENNLAKKYTLFNGTDEPSALLRSGVSPVNTFDGGNYAYGIGGTEFGLNPMMGITSISVNHENRGSLRRASVKIRAHNKVQFEIIDVLYLRLGFQVLLEWGNSIYLDNNDIFQSNPQFSLADEFLKGSPTTTYETLLQSIYKQRIASHGNYDAMLAKVTNFHWSVNKDGSYDIEVNLASIGDIIESLKVNVSNKPAKQVTLTKKDEEERSADLEESEDFFIIKAKSNTAIGEFFSTFMIPNFEDDPDFYLEDSDYTVLEDDQFNNPLNTIYFSNAQGLSFKLSDWFVNISSVLPLLTSPPNLNLKKFTNRKQRDFLGIIWDNYLNIKTTALITDGNGSRMFYVRLGTFLQFLQDVVMLQQNTPSPNAPFLPALKFDYDVETNLMNTINHQVSVDPKFCVVSKKVDLEKIVSDNGHDYAIFNPCGSNVTALMSETVYYPQSDEKEGDFISDKLKHIGQYGRIMNIFVNCKFIIDKMDELADDKGDVVMIDFLQGILDGVNEGLGGINDFDVFIDETTNTVKVIDKNPLKNRDAVLEYIHGNPTLFPYAHILPKQEISTALAEFQLFGYKNDHAGFVKDFTFTTELTPAFSTMITVGAAANASVVGEENTALSRINKGLVDRYKKIVVNVVDPVEEEKIIDDKTKKIDDLKEKLNVRITEFEEFIINMSQSQVVETFTEGAEYNESDVSLYKGVLKEIQQLEQDLIDAEESLNPKPNPPLPTRSGFIPFNLSLTMDGLSGMKINEKFIVDTDFLPSNYPDNVEFLIKNLVHEVANNKWITKIDSYCIAKQSEPTQPSRTIPRNGGGNQGGGNQGDGGGVVVGGAPMTHVDDPSLSKIRNEIVKIAKSYVGQAEVPGFDNQKFVNAEFEKHISNMGWFSSPASHWCNWFADLVWKEAYFEVSKTNPKILTAYQKIFKRQKTDTPDLTAGVFRTLANAVAEGYGRNLGGVFIKSSSVVLPIPGDLVVYSSGHINICVSVDSINRTFATIGGNEGKNNSRNGASVSYKPQYWSTQKIAGIVTVIE